MKHLTEEELDYLALVIKGKERLSFDECYILISMAKRLKSAEKIIDMLPIIETYDHETDERLRCILGTNPRKFNEALKSYESQSK